MVYNIPHYNAFIQNFALYKNVKNFTTFEKLPKLLMFSIKIVKSTSIYKKPMQQSAYNPLITLP